MVMQRFGVLSCTFIANFQKFSWIYVSQTQPLLLHVNWRTWTFYRKTFTGWLCATERQRWSPESIHYWSEGTSLAAEGGSEHQTLAGSQSASPTPRLPGHRGVAHLTLPSPPFPFRPFNNPPLLSARLPSLGLHFLLYLVLPFYFLPLILQKCYLSPPPPTINKPSPAVFQSLGGDTKTHSCPKLFSLWAFLPLGFFAFGFFF